MKSEPAGRDQKSEGERRTSPKPSDEVPGSPGETTAFTAGGLTSRIQPVSPNLADQPTLVEPAATVAAEPPKKVGRFRIQKLLGRGGMGSVYLAHDDQLDRPVALKIPSKPDDAEAAGRLVSRFLREARAAAVLSHPNICPIYDVGQDGDTHFIAMGFVKGQPLATYATSDKRQPSRQVALVIRKVALALEDAHEKGILHRDLKPANIMIDQRGEPIVMDFGLACRLDDRWETRLTQDGSVVGTPTYMAPEQIDGRCEVGPASDVYSLGVVMYELLVGQCPFSGSLVSVIGQVLHVEPKPVTELRSDVPVALAEICHRAMAKNLPDRFASMKDFAAALTDFLKGTTFIAKPAAAVAPAPLVDLGQIDALLSGPLSGTTNLGGPTLRRKTSRARRPRMLWATAIGAAGVLIVAIAWIVFAGRISSGPDEHGSATNVVAHTGDDVRPVPAGHDAEKAAPIHEDPASPPAEKSTTTATMPDVHASSPTAPLQSPVSLPVTPDSNSASPTGAAQADAKVESKPDAEPKAVGSDASPSIPSPVAKDGNGGLPAIPPSSSGNSPSAGPPGAPPGPAPAAGPPNGGPGGAAFAEIDSVDALVKFFKQADRNHTGRLDPSELPLHIIYRAAKKGEQSVNLPQLKSAYAKMGSALFAPPSAVELRKLQNPPGGPRRGNSGPPGPGGPPPGQGGPPLPPSNQ